MGTSKDSKICNYPIIYYKNTRTLLFQDLHTLDLEPFQYSGMNFTAVRLIDPEDYMVRRIIEDFFAPLGITEANQLTLEQALMFDGVQLFARAFKQLSDSVKGELKQLPCDGSENWEHGISLSNFIRSVRSYEDQNMYSLKLCCNTFIFPQFFLNSFFFAD